MTSQNPMVSGQEAWWQSWARLGQLTEGKKVIPCLSG